MNRTIVHFKPLQFYRTSTREASVQTQRNTLSDLVPQGTGFEFTQSNQHRFVWYPVGHPARSGIDCATLWNMRNGVHRKKHRATARCILKALFTLTEQDKGGKYTLRMTLRDFET